VIFVGGDPVRFSIDTLLNASPMMETDLASGRLDNLIAKAEADIATHQVKDLDEVLHNP
jgi:hypothetical protein